MARPKRRYPVWGAARTYLQQHAPELLDRPLRIRMLDGPPHSPRYAAMAEMCTTSRCPHGVSPEAAAAVDCPVLTCPLRRSVRILLDAQGTVVQAIHGDIHWR